MPYEINSSPEETADLFKSFHRAVDSRTRHRLIDEAPLPSGCVLSFKVARSETHDQDRINLPKDLALSMDRVWGRVISLREEKESANTETKACANVLLKIPFWDSKVNAYRSFFARTNAYFSNFAPRQPDSMSWNLVRGDIISGLLQRPFIPPSIPFAPE